MAPQQMPDSGCGIPSSLLTLWVDLHGLRSKAAVADSVVVNSRTQKTLCCIVAILLSTEADARLCARRGSSDEN